MDRLKATLSYSLPFIAFCIAIFSCNQARGDSDKYVCNQQYALCTSAACIPMPGDATKAICFCAVENGKSMSTVPCNNLKPSTDEKGIVTVYSTFSLEQFKQGKKSMKCPSGTPWTWCLNKRCTVDPMNPEKAICTCDVMNTGEWTTLGGACDTATCKTGFWSGAGIKDYEEGNEYMTKALNLDTSPAKWCEKSGQ